MTAAARKPDELTAALHDSGPISQPGSNDPGERPTLCGWSEPDERNLDQERYEEHMEGYLHPGSYLFWRIAQSEGTRRSSLCPVPTAEKIT